MARWDAGDAGEERGVERRQGTDMVGMAGQQGSRAGQGKQGTTAPQHHKGKSRIRICCKVEGGGWRDKIR